LKSRRGFLRLAGSIAVGVGVLLISDGLVGTQLIRNGAEHLEASLVVSNDAANSKASLITVKAYYTLMAQYTPLSEEDFVLQSPATLQDLINTCLVRHPSMTQMMGTMLILLDGAPSKPSAALRDGDTVQFIPLTAGG
jgi:molybdopterin converting factor small subunit